MAQWTIKHPDGTQSVVGGIVGALVPFAGATPPAHTLLCNGADVSRTTYAELFAVIGTAWGTGDGSTTFNLPNYADGKFLRGTGGNAAALGTSQAEGLPNITGSYWSNGWNTPNFSADGALQPVTNTWKVFAQTNEYNGTAGFSLDASRSSAIYGASSHVTPYNGASTICIVYE